MTARAVLFTRHFRRRLSRRIAAATFDRLDRPDPVPLLWSKGIALACDARGDDDYWHRPTENVEPEERFVSAYRHAAGRVWVRLSTRARAGLATDLDTFARRVVPALHRPFVLVTTDGDIGVPSEVRVETVDALLASPAMVAWYTQNHDGGRPERIRPIPIGLDLHTPRPWTSPRGLVERLATLRAERVDAARQPLRVVCDLGLSLASVDRARAVVAVSRLPWADNVDTRLSQPAIWRRYAASPFVLSSRGNGLDAHRTWEALCLGSIVVTTRSSLAPLYEGLPVAIVDDWREVADLANLRRWQEELAPLTDRDRVWGRLAPEHWTGRMDAELESRTAPRVGREPPAHR